MITRCIPRVVIGRDAAYSLRRVYAHTWIQLRVHQAATLPLWRSNNSYVSILFALCSIISMIMCVPTACVAEGLHQVSAVCSITAAIRSQSPVCPSVSVDTFRLRIRWNESEAPGRCGVATTILGNRT